MLHERSLYQHHIGLQRVRLPKGVSWIDPYSNPEVCRICRIFHDRFYADYQERDLILGINPGRYGAGITGLAFTDPMRLSEILGFNTDLSGVRELSAEFIYAVIERLGGVEVFYGNYYLSSVCPLGFIKDNKNYNYYDDEALFKRVSPVIRIHVEYLLEYFNPSRVILLGTGKNARAFRLLNDRYGWVDEPIYLEHPRYIMQYRRKYLEDYLHKYLTLLSHRALLD